MIVISDTSPLQYLAVLERIELLHRLFDEIHCPNVVLRECLHPQAPEVLRAWAASVPEWVVVDEVREVDPDLEFLDDGEAAALTLGRRLGAELLLIDERDGRRCAIALGFAVAGTLNILAQAGTRGWLDYHAEVARLRQVTNFRVTDFVVHAVWEEAKT
jgi:predicted nucleic acid-binding protein